MADLDALARQHGVSVEAVRVLKHAIRQGGGRMAQFSHPELGGMGQWSAGGMTQIGTMSDDGLRARVAALCAALAEAPSTADALRDDAARPPAPGAAADWWPSGLGRPSSSGAQNALRYACFPEHQRVAIEQDGVVTLYDSGAHRISGVAQAQGGSQDLRFTSQLGTVRAEDLPVAQ